MSCSYRYDAKSDRMMVLDEKTGEWKPDKSRSKKLKAGTGYTVMPDIKEFVSPVDGSLISSRSKLFFHNRGHGVKQCGDFKPGEIIARTNAKNAEVRKLAEGATAKWI